MWPICCDCRYYYAPSCSPADRQDRTGLVGMQQVVMGASEGEFYGQMNTNDEKLSIQITELFVRFISWIPIELSTTIIVYSSTRSSVDFYVRTLTIRLFNCFRRNKITGQFRCYLTINATLVFPVKRLLLCFAINYGDYFEIQFPDEQQTLHALIITMDWGTSHQRGMNRRGKLRAVQIIPNRVNMAFKFVFQEKRLPLPFLHLRLVGKSCH